MVEGSEACDLEDLQGASCESRGYDYGELRCATDCVGFDESACARATCGDGLLEPSEVCDDGNVASETACPYGQATCEACDGSCAAVLTLTGDYCGDGEVNGDEACDDGNSVTETACPAYGTVDCVTCRADCMETRLLDGEYCGDGVVNGPEGCDEGALNGTFMHCRSDCSGRFAEVGPPDDVNIHLLALEALGTFAVAAWGNLGPIYEETTAIVVYDAQGNTVSMRNDVRGTARCKSDSEGGVAVLACEGYFHPVIFVVEDDGDIFQVRLDYDYSTEFDSYLDEPVVAGGYLFGLDRLSDDYDPAVVLQFFLGEAAEHVALPLERVLPAAPGPSFASLAGDSTMLLAYEADGVPHHWAPWRAYYNQFSTEGLPDVSPIDAGEYRAFFPGVAGGTDIYWLNRWDDWWYEPQSCDVEMSSVAIMEHGMAFPGPWPNQVSVVEGHSCPFTPLAVESGPEDSTSFGQYLSASDDVLVIGGSDYFRIYAR